MSAASQPSVEFREAVESALKAPTAEQRVEQLVQTIETGSINDVALGISGYFPHDILRIARSDDVCKQETETLLSIMRNATEVQFEEYMESKHYEYREALADSVLCIHMAYREGIPSRP